MLLDAPVDLVILTSKCQLHGLELLEAIKADALLKATSTLVVGALFEQDVRRNCPFLGPFVRNPSESSILLRRSADFSPLHQPAPQFQPGTVVRHPVDRPVLRPKRSGLTSSKEAKFFRSLL